MTTPVSVQAKNHLKSQVKSLLAEKFSGGDTLNKLELLEVFWQQLAIADWAGKEVSDIAGCIDSLWSMFETREHGPSWRSGQSPMVRIFNPSMDVNGWLCNGTVIMIRQVDMPFLVDSIRLELNRRDISIHTIKSTLVAVEVNNGEVIKVAAPGATMVKNDTYQQEALIYVEVGLLVEQSELYELKESLTGVLNDVSIVVAAYPQILDCSKALSLSLQQLEQSTDVEEALAFVSWLEGGHFTYLGYREFDCAHDTKKDVYTLSENVSKQIGLFTKYCGEGSAKPFVAEGAVDAFYRCDEIVSISKSSTRSSVHRSVYPDYIVMKRFNKKGDVIGEARILGLFTYGVYTLNTSSIPIIRRKVAKILESSGLLPQSHDGKNLRRVLETFPRDELFQADYTSLCDAVNGVAMINEKGAVKLLMRKDPFNKFVNCIAYVPRDSYNTKVRLKIEALIGGAIDSTELDSTTYFSESILARAYMVFRLKDNANIEFDSQSLETSVDDLARGWEARFGAALIESFGDREGHSLYQKFKNSFSVAYQESFDPRTAIADVKLIQELKSDADIALRFYQPLHSEDQHMRFKVLHLNSTLELSDVVPILEYLGLRVAGEHPYKLTNSNDDIIWLHDFSLVYGLDCRLEVATVSKLFENAFAAVWRKNTDSDGFNRLVLGARLDWREVAMLRAYAAYMKQTSFTFGQDYIADTLVNQVEITRNLVALFKATFDPRVNKKTEACVTRIDRLKEKLLVSFDEVANLNEDKILRRYLDFINATKRTNFYQTDENGNLKNYIALKFSPRELEDIPSPKPLYEIYVYSPQVEGVHLRGGKVARGGIRWSDRHQDYRTEVLGLVKAQQVKNAVIVPTGAKGGFISKRQALMADRDAMMAEGIECYKTFMRGLLDTTDNFVAGELVAPRQVVCMDEPDPYLVVAADKGTATFSDIANAVSAEYSHWLGDAFASGGSQGYDHKKMGITAKGAWVSVQRHFRERGLDVQNEEFTVIGVGDMAGDVFGNGMLLSEHIQLVAAFNHAHIFIDPNPDAQKSFSERKRLFELPRSSWEDYKKDLISEGGGIFLRAAKSVKISSAMKKRFGFEHSQVTPTELIQLLLKAPVDLIWNGGIGTYVKSTQQSHVDVGDKANDALRVNGKDLRCKVFGEGGNLGMTQLGRVEYALNGGGCNTDFIDNAAGVDCSDHEVNIKILLQEVTQAGDLTVKQRNQLLVEMTDEVSELVLNNNYHQTMALSLAQWQAKSRTGEFKRFIRRLEKEGRLDRQLEYLPSDSEVAEREKSGSTFTRPELAVILSYAKVGLKEAFILEDLTSEPILYASVETAFPSKIVERYSAQIYAHRLAKEIVATQLANDIVHILGITAAQRLAASTGSSLKEVAVAFACAKTIFKMDQFIDYMRTMDNKISSDDQYELLANMERRVRRGTRWFLRNRHVGYDPVAQAQAFSLGITELNDVIKKATSAEVNQTWASRIDQLTALGLDGAWISQLSVPDYMFSGLSAVEVGLQQNVDAKSAGIVLFAFYEHFDLNWVAKMLSFMPVENGWQAKARETYLDELDNQLRLLVTKFFLSGTTARSGADVEEWLMPFEDATRRWLDLVSDVRSEEVVDFAVISVLVGELVDCVSKRIP